MKAHFKLPLRNDDSFHDVEYVELAEENSFRQVQQLVMYLFTFCYKHNNHLHLR